MEHSVVFQPSGRRGKVRTAKTLLEAARELGVGLENVCGGAQACGKCRVKVETGFFEKLGITSRPEHLSPPGEAEMELLGAELLSQGYRLACAASVRGDVLVYVPEESQRARQVILESGRERSFTLNPAVRKYYVELSRPTLQDHRDDLRRLREALSADYGLSDDLEIDYWVLQDLPEVLRRGDWKATVAVWMDREIIKVEPGRAEEAYGVAVDVGTTTVAAYLCDLTRGVTIARNSAVNPQVQYGEDIISRITYCVRNPDGLEQMHQAVVECINELVRMLAAESGIDPEDVLEIVLVGNTAMHHLLCKLDPRYLGRAPFIPVLKESAHFKARELGIRICPGGRAFLLPIEAGFVGADNVAVLLAEEPYQQEEEIWLIIDIGTNGEVNLGNRRRLLCTSCATGPALEGAQIRFGMRAAPGAIERVRIDPDTLEVCYKVIGCKEWYPGAGRSEAVGICGSGLIDAVAEMFKAGIILPSGNINLKAINSPRLRTGEGGMPEFVIAWAQETAIGRDITINQADVRAVQLAKAALYVGAKSLMKKFGTDRIDKIILAGAFGTYIDPLSAMVIGMIPDCDLHRVVAVGNAAGDGAQIALYNRDKRREADRVARWVEFVEAAAEPDYQEQFVAALPFPHARDDFPHVRHLLRRVNRRVS